MPLTDEIESVGMISEATDIVTEALPDTGATSMAPEDTVTVKTYDLPPLAAPAPITCTADVDNMIKLGQLPPKLGDSS